MGQKGENMNRDDHPAWAIYNLFRTAKLNEKYHERKMHDVETLNFAIELALAITTPGGTISALWFWSDPVGAVVWKVCLVLAAIASLLKPLLKLPDKMKILQECLSGYRLLVFDLREIINDLIEKRVYDDEIKKRYKDAIGRTRDLVTKDSGIKKNKKLIHKLTDEVNKELEGFNFFIPEEE